MPKKPFGFILENVEGLVTHDREDKKDKIGRTLRVILSKLEGLGYKVTWKVLNSKDFGLAQERKRIYIAGTLDEKVSLDKFEKSKAVLADVLQKGQPTIETDFTRLLLSHPVERLARIVLQSIHDVVGVRHFHGGRFPQCQRQVGSCRVVRQPETPFAIERDVLLRQCGK